jgi:hypothetical protein
MAIFGYVKDILTLASILGLIVVGLAIALRSGWKAVGPDHCKLVLANLSSLVFAIAGSLLALGVIQHFIGVRLDATW